MACTSSARTLLALLSALQPQGRISTLAPNPQSCGGVQMVFSSSCTVYGDVQKEHVPIKESTPLAAMSPYGRTKLMIEVGRPGWPSCSALLRWLLPTLPEPKRLALQQQIVVLDSTATSLAWCLCLAESQPMRPALRMD